MNSCEESVGDVNSCEESVGDVNSSEESVGDVNKSEVTWKLSHGEIIINTILTQTGAAKTGK